MNLSNIKKEAPEYTVSGITEAIKSVIYDNFSAVKIRGEISGLKVSSKGHVYFTLKDAQNTINAVCFASIFKKIKISMTDGVEVLAYGSIDTFGSGYQLKVESVEYAGVGALMKLMEERKQKLYAMGLFDQKYKKPIPPSYAIENIGVITSATGAVIQDIINRITERYPKNILLFGAVVQGVEAPEQIIAGIKYFNNIATVKPDVIIIARGGGSIEDLFCFNDEQIAMAVFESKIPIISAIGHEVDTTIIDYVSDLRAATPTAAAEIVTTPTLLDISESLSGTRNNFTNIAKKILVKSSENVIFLQHRVAGMKNRVLVFSQDLSMIKSRFYDGFNKLFFNYSQIHNSKSKAISVSKDKMYTRLDKLNQKLKKFDQIINFFAQNILNKINNLKNKLNINLWRLYDSYCNNLKSDKAKVLQAINIKVQKTENHYSSLQQSISYLDFAKNLRKGYSIVLDKNNKITKNIDKLKNLDLITIKMQDGIVQINK